MNRMSVLQPKVVVSGDNIRKVGAESRINVNEASTGALQPFSVTLNNPVGSGDQLFVIGDSEGLVAGVTGLTLLEPTGGTVAPAVMKKMLKYPIALSKIKYAVENSASQFSNNIELYVADIDGTYAKKIISSSASKNNDQFNDKLLTLDVAGKVRINAFRALIIKVKEGETVTLDLIPSEAAGR